MSRQHDLCMVVRAYRVQAGGGRRFRVTGLGLGVGVRGLGLGPQGLAQFNNPNVVYWGFVFFDFWIVGTTTIEIVRASENFRNK